MISDERRAMNDRFKVAFELLEDRGAVVKNDRRGRGIKAFASKVLGKPTHGHIIRAYVSDTNARCISYEQAKRVCYHYGVNEAYLLHGQGEPFGEALPTAEVLTPDGPVCNTVLTTAAAFASSPLDGDSFVKEEVRSFHIPGITGTGHVAFPVRGDSMEPEIKSGDHVVCRPLDDLSTVRDNQVYAIYHNGKTMVKYVQKKLDRKTKRITGLRLLSANYLEHEPFEEEVNTSTKLFEIVARITPWN